MHLRCCPRCGYPGWELQQHEQPPFECPNCDEDLYARRPLSYAEREGLVPVEEHAATLREPARKALLLVRVARGLRSLARRLLRV